MCNYPTALSKQQTKKKQYPIQPPRAVSPGRRTQSSSDPSNHFRSCRQGRALQSDGAAPAYAPCTTKTAADCAPGQNPCSKISCISHPALCKGLCWLAAVLPQSPQQLAKLFPIIPFSIHFFFFFFCLGVITPSGRKSRNAMDTARKSCQLKAARLE